MPQHRLAIEMPQPIPVLTSDALGAGGLEVVDQRRDIERWMDVHQQAYMVFLGAELQQRTAPRLGDLGKGG